MITIFFRKIKKLALELVKLCATTNLYKRTKILDYTKSFIEAYNAFSVCVNDNTENTPFDEIQGFIEFIVIFFPQQKVEAIIQSLQISKEVDLSMLDDQLHFLRERNKTTKRFIEIWTKKSCVLKKIFKIVQEVLNTSDFLSNPYSDYLKLSIAKFMN